jgi:adenylate kinase family enzyme
MQRIMIVGSAGSGKSTFARQLGEKLGLPVVHLDTLYWRPGWVEPPQDVWREQVRGAVQADAWVMDGNYSANMDLRFERADTAIFLDIPRRVCLYRVLKRAITHRGKVRSDCAPGCPERFDWFFLKWVWSFPTQRRPAMLERLANAPEAVRVVHLHNDREIEAFLGKVGNGR